MSGRTNSDAPERRTSDVKRSDASSSQPGSRTPSATHKKPSTGSPLSPIDGNATKSPTGSKTSTLKKDSAKSSKTDKISAEPVPRLDFGAPVSATQHQPFKADSEIRVLNASKSHWYAVTGKKVALSLTTRENFSDLFKNLNMFPEDVEAIAKDENDTAIVVSSVDLLKPKSFVAEYPFFDKEHLNVSRLRSVSTGQIGVRFGHTTQVWNWVRKDKYRVAILPCTIENMELMGEEIYKAKPFPEYCTVPEFLKIYFGEWTFKKILEKGDKKKDARIARNLLPILANAKVNLTYLPGRTKDNEGPHPDWPPPEWNGIGPARKILSLDVSAANRNFRIKPTGAIEYRTITVESHYEGIYNLLDHANRALVYPTLPVAVTSRRPLNIHDRKSERISVYIPLECLLIQPNQVFMKPQTHEIYYPVKSKG